MTRGSKQNGRTFYFDACMRFYESLNQSVAFGGVSEGGYTSIVSEERRSVGKGVRY